MNNVWKSVLDEAERAHGKYGQPTSAHESLGVLIEEVDELRHAIHMNKAAGVSLEAIQVAAVAYRLAVACESGNPSFFERSGFKVTA